MKDMKHVNKKSALISTTAILLALMICLVAGLVGCDNKQPEEETQNPFQSVLSPQTTEKPKKDIEYNDINTDSGWNDIK